MRTLNEFISRPAGLCSLLLKAVLSGPVPRLPLTPADPSYRHAVPLAPRLHSTHSGPTYVIVTRSPLSVTCSA